MRNIFFATQEQVDLARRAEDLLFKVPSLGGILFVGATIADADGWQLRITVGCNRGMETSTIEALVWSVIAKDPELDAVKDRTKVQVFRGVARSPR